MYIRRCIYTACWCSVPRHLIALRENCENHSQEWDSFLPFSLSREVLRMCRNCELGARMGKREGDEGSGRTDRVRGRFLKCIPFLSNIKTIALDASSHVNSREFFPTRRFSWKLQFGERKREREKKRSDQCRRERERRYLGHRANSFLFPPPLPESDP